MLLAFDLERAGCEVLTTNSGESALTILTNTSIDLIILDLHMPGLSGFGTLKTLKADSNLQNIPVIMLSASDLEDEIVEAFELGAEDYIVKPYTKRVLLARVNKALRLKHKNNEIASLENEGDEHIDKKSKVTETISDNNTNEEANDLSSKVEQSEGFSIAGVDTSIGLSNVLGDKALYLEILKMFYHEHKEDGNKLNQAIVSNDYDSAKHVSHTLKGVSSSIGAMALFELTKQLDSEIGEPDSNLQPLVDQVDVQLKAVMASILEATEE